MNNNEYVLIKQYLGIEFIKYVFHYQGEISWDKKFEQLDFNSIQIQCLDEASNLIRNIRIQFIMENGFGDGLHFRLKMQSGISEFFNSLRIKCGGSISWPKENDSIISFLYKLAGNQYPCFLIFSRSQEVQDNMNFFSNFDHRLEFSKLVKADSLNKLTNEREDLDYRLDFTLSTGEKYATQVCMLADQILSRSFHNCTMRGKVDLQSFYAEIKRNVEILRNLALKGEAEVSAFAGIQGLYFEGLNEFKLSNDKVILRKIDSLENPCSHSLRTAATHSNGDGKSIISGVFIEVISEVKLHKVHRADGPASSISKLPDINGIIDSLKLAIVFVKDEIKGFNESFFENGFPLSHVGSCAHFQRRYSELIEINSEDGKQIINWFNLLCQKDVLDNLEIPLTRLRHAIFERNDIKDAIVDAFIAWEGLFSEALETSFKISTSITKFLEEKDKRQEYFKKINELYGLRSKIVHGKKNKKPLFKNEDPKKIKDEIIQIGLKCIKKIIQNEHGLLTLDPGERVKIIALLL